MNVDRNTNTSFCFPQGVSGVQVDISDIKCDVESGVTIDVGICDDIYNAIKLLKRLHRLSYFN